MKKIITLFISSLILLSVSVVKVNAQGCNCWPARDTSFHPVPFSYCTSECSSMSAPYYRCDDAGTKLIVLPFNFCFWGKTQDSVYINENGNITLGKYGKNYTTFSPDTFPNPSNIVPPMIAPFWGDVDSYGAPAGGSDLVLYKITAHYMIVQWDSVGYYNSHRNKLNSFEVIISDGTDPIIPKGNNVEFCYRDMEWTTGDASSGVGGFGGDPATVGANEGDGSRFVQIGLFDSPGISYFGQFPPAPNYDEVSWLSNKSFLFNLCAGSISPLISGISPCDTFRVCEGDSIHIPFYFFSPIQGDSVWSNLAPPIPSGVSIFSNRPGHTDSLIVSVVGSAANAGYHTINVYGYDNATPQDTTYTSFVIQVDTAPSVHLTAIKDTICVGDSSILTASGGHTYIWSNGKTTSSIKVGPATTQTYTVGVSDGGCVKDTTLKLYVYPVVGPPTITFNPLCYRDSTLFTCVASGATVYDWNFGDPASGRLDSSLLQNTGHIFTHIGTFTVTLKTNNGTPCGARDTSFPVTIVAVPSPVVSGDTSICIGSFDTLTVTGGTNYVWSPGGATGSSIVVNPLSTTTYTITASNGACTSTTTVKVSTYNPPVTTVVSTPDTICLGQNAVITGNGIGVYKWSNGSTTTAITVSPAINTRYYLRDSIKGSECLDTASVLVVVRASLSASISRDTTVCPNQPVLLNVNVSGESATYKWSNGATGSSILVAPTTTTTYTSIVSGQYCNHDTLKAKVTVIPLAYPIVTGTDWKCLGIRDTLYVTSNYGPATFVWDNGKTTSSITTGPIKADSVITVTSYNSLGCPHDTSFDITLRQKPTVVANPPATFCAGSPITLTATGGGTPPPSSYTWSTGQTGSSITITPGPDVPTTYVVTASNGCKATATTTASPNFPILTACCNQSLTIINDTLTPSYVVLNAQGNSKKYQWIDSNNVYCLNPPLCDSVRVNPKTTTTYTVIGTDSNGCTAEQLITITVEVPCFNLIIPNVFTPTNGGPLGLNKIFYIDTRNIDGWSISIYDRWGKVMFSSTDQYKYWDGTTEGGGDAPSGVYYYVITGTCQSTSYKKEGFVQLIR